MKINLDHNSKTYTVDLIPSGKSYRAVRGDKHVDVQILRAANGRLDLLIDGERVTVYVSTENARRWVTVNGQTCVLTRQSAARRSTGGTHHTAGELTAPMPGQIRAVNVREGEAVTRGQTLIILEAMKMEIRIQAPLDGVVKTLAVQQGQTVEREQPLITVE